MPTSPQLISIASHSIGSSNSANRETQDEASAQLLHELAQAIERTLDAEMVVATRSGRQSLIAAEAATAWLDQGRKSGDGKQGEGAPVEQETTTKTKKRKRVAGSNGIELQNGLVKEVQAPEREISAGIGAVESAAVGITIEINAQDAPKGTLLNFDDDSGPLQTKDVGSSSLQTGTEKPEELRLQAENVQAEESDDDDAAPEEATTIAGNDRLGSASAKIADLLAVKEEAKRVKKREHEARMLAQVERLKKKALKKERKEQKRSQREDADGLPDLLPQELLDAEPVTTALPTPISSPVRTTSLSKRDPYSALDIERPPKDLIKGNTKIRVIPQTSTILPPKVSTKSHAIRQKWLLGQRGPGPQTWVRRQKPSTGFVRPS